MSEFYEPRKKKSKLMMKLNPNDKPLSGIILLAVTGVFTIAASVFILTRGKPEEVNNNNLINEDNNTSIVSDGDITNVADMGISEMDAWMYKLVNFQNPIEENYANSLTFVMLKGDLKFDQRAYKDLQAMINACRDEELSPIIVNAYRTISKQQQIFSETYTEVRRSGLNDEDAAKKTEELVENPGESEHHTGLAIDIACESHETLDKELENTAEYKWLVKNCWKYGFIQRYPSGKKDITGISYEPWHFRYVGKDAAEYITKNNITLEEFLVIIASKSNNSTDSSSGQQ